VKQFEVAFMESLKIVLLMLCFAAHGLSARAEEEFLKWNTQDDRVSASIRTWTTDQLLHQIASATGWEIFMEPGDTNRIFSKFSGIRSRDALAMLLSDAHYAVLPQTNLPPKLLVYRTSPSQATRKIATPNEKKLGKKGAVPNELVVSLKEGANVDELAKKLGAKVLDRVDELRTYRLGFNDAASTEAARKALANESSLSQVDQNYYVNRPATADPLGPSVGGFPTLEPAKQGEGKVIVGLIDMPVERTGGPSDALLLDGISVAGNANNPGGGNGQSPSHGTAMYQTLYKSLASVNETGGTTGVRVLPVDIYGGAQETTTFNLAKGIHAAVSAGANIINLSLGGENDSPLLHSLISEASKRGVVFLAAAGNAPTTAPVFPAAYPEVLAVTAGDRNGNIAQYANRGDFVDLIAPGASVVQFGGQKYVVSGTSSATAYAAGVAAGLADGTKRPPAEVVGQVQNTFGLSTQQSRPTTR
jgi:hypothetical protein